MNIHVHTGQHSKTYLITYLIHSSFCRYSNVARNEFFLNSHSDKAELLKAIEGISYMGQSTNTSGGILTAMHEQFTTTKGDRLNSPNVIILLTDGVSNIDKHRTISDAEEARNKGIEIFTVGITNSINEDEVKGMSSVPQEEGTNYFKTADFMTLLALRDVVGQSVCQLTHDKSK